MKKYLVGGAVRDILLNNPVVDRDWVVVGAKPQDLLNNGFIQIGKDFPVFLHPETKEEYALARTERKSGQGYTGFICDFNDKITLEQDLARRDLTINAIAMNKNNQLIDPFNGVADLNQRILRHVSPAFAEDPLRVLRVARFAARFHHLGFTIAAETLQLMQSIVKQGEMQTLTTERVWQETEKAFTTQDPQLFFAVLKQCDALVILYPEIEPLFNIQSPQQSQSGSYTLSTLKYASLLTTEPTVRFAALCCHLDKVNNQHDYQQNKQFAKQQLEQLCKRLRVPNHYKRIANIASQYYDQVHHIDHLTAENILELLNHIDVWRNPNHLQQLTTVSYADAKAMNNDNNLFYPQKNYLAAAYTIAKSVSIQEIIQQGFIGKGIQTELTHQRIMALKQWKN